MTAHELASLTDQELLVLWKQKKSRYYLNAGLIGFIAGVAIYSTVKNGFGIFTLLPLFLIYSAATSHNDYKIVKKEIESRKLK